MTAPGAPSVLDVAPPNAGAQALIRTKRFWIRMRANDGTGAPSVLDVAPPKAGAQTLIRTKRSWIPASEGMPATPSSGVGRLPRVALFPRPSVGDDGFQVGVAWRPAELGADAGAVGHELRGIPGAARAHFLRDGAAADTARRLDDLAHGKT